MLGLDYLIIACVWSYFMTKNIGQTEIAKATGKVPASYTREQNRVKEGRAWRPITARRSAERFFVNAWDDAWESAEQIRAHRHAKRTGQRREKWAAEDGRPDATPAPVTTSAKPEATPTSQIPNAPGQAPTPVKPTPQKPKTPDTGVDDGGPYALLPGGKEEEAAYQRYAMRRRNGSAPDAFRISNELGVNIQAAEAIKKRWDARYNQESGTSEPTPREQHDQKVTELADATPAPAAQDEKADGTAETERKDAEKKAGAPGLSLEERMQRAVEDRESSSPQTRPATSPAPTNATPINGTENHDMTTANAETTGLQSALNYNAAMAEKAGEGASSVEMSIAALEQGEVGSAVTSPMAQGREHLEAAQACFQQAHDELQQHMNVREAYDATPDAGNKQFVTAE